MKIRRITTEEIEVDFDADISITDLEMVFEEIGDTDYASTLTGTSKIEIE